MDSVCAHSYQTCYALDEKKYCFIVKTYFKLHFKFFIYSLYKPDRHVFNDVIFYFHKLFDEVPRVLSLKI
jgi:hypothetical protein